MDLLQQKVNNRWKENKIRLQHNRLLLQKLKNFKFAVKEEVKLLEPKPVPEAPTKSRDVQELEDLIQLCNNKNTELEEEQYKRFKIYLDLECTNSVEYIQKYYCNNFPRNSHFRLSYFNNIFRVSYRNGFFYYLDEYPETILNYTNEIGRLVVGFRKIKNTNDLSTYQLLNSVKLKHSLKVPATTRILHSIE